MNVEMMTPLLSPMSIILSCVAAFLVYLVLPSARDRAVQHLLSPEENYPILKHSLQLFKVRKSGKFLDWILKYCQTYQSKPWYFQSLGKEPCVVLCCPEAFEDVLKTQFDAFDKSPNVVEAMHDLLGQGIFAVSGPLWQRQRKTAGHLFTANMMQYAMEVVAPKMCEELVKRLDKICQKEHEADHVVNMKRLLELYTMDVFAKVGFGVDLHGVKLNQNAEPLDAFERISVRILKRIQQPKWVWKLLRWLNVGPERQFAEDIKVTDEFIYEIISRSIEEKTHDGSSAGCRKDLISLFIEKWKVEFTNGMHTKKDLKLLRDFAVSLLAAGRETTATAMSWVLLMLNRYPKVLEQIRQEIQDKLPDLACGKMRSPSLENIQHLVYLEATIRETLRLFPIVAITGRSATRDVCLYEGTFIKAGTRVLLPHYAMGRMITVWGPDVNEFKPERWLDPTTNTLKVMSPFKFSTFLGGPRICLGMKFAVMEMKITLAKLLSQFDMKTVEEPFHLTYRPSLTLQIKGPLDVTVSRLKR